jgi:formylmethanofuran dehydrogenase subunit E
VRRKSGEFNMRKSRIYIGIALVFLLSFSLMVMDGVSHSDHEDEGMHSRVVYQKLTPELLERFHGHLGPFVAFGGLIGEHAIQTYAMPRYFGVSVKVYCPAAPPPACLVDGLQVSLGVTYGKKNIEHIASEAISVLVTDVKKSETYEYTIKESAMKMLAEWEAAGMDVEERGHALFAMKPMEVLNVKKITPAK